MQQHSDAGEAPSRGPSVSSQALYHWATALPTLLRVETCTEKLINDWGCNFSTINSTLYVIETPFDAFANRPDPGQVALVRATWL